MSLGTPVPQPSSLVSLSADRSHVRLNSLTPLPACIPFILPLPLSCHSLIATDLVPNSHSAAVLMCFPPLLATPVALPVHNSKTAIEPFCPCVPNVDPALGYGRLID